MSVDVRIKYAISLVNFQLVISVRSLYLNMLMFNSAQQQRTKRIKIAFTSVQDLQLVLSHDGFTFSNYVR